MNTRIEIWNGHEIRFVEVQPGKWWAVARDVASALEYKDTTNAIKQHCKGVVKRHVPTVGGKQLSNIIPPTDIYRMIFKSEQPDAEAFQDWVCELLEELQRASGLEGFEVFRMLDKEHQKDAMRRLRDGLVNPVRVDFIKANTITNSATSKAYGHPKMLKKNQMTPDMLVARQGILDDTVNLMKVNESFDMGLSVSEMIYGKYGR